jgi:hypothetical protein
MLVKEPNENGYTSIEIDESSIIGNFQVILLDVRINLKKFKRCSHFFYNK